MKGVPDPITKRFTHREEEGAGEGEKEKNQQHGLTSISQSVDDEWDSTCQSVISAHVMRICRIHANGDDETRQTITLLIKLQIRLMDADDGRDVWTRMGHEFNDGNEDKAKEKKEKAESVNDAVLPHQTAHGMEDCMARWESESVSHLILFVTLFEVRAICVIV